MIRKHSKSPREFLKRVYNSQENLNRYAYTYSKQRVGGIAWFSEDKQKALKKSLIAKEHLLIGS
tara:strand:- start:4205 stop:4396 length:192 start_codon:yes stop_codon:yes gene_type:complete